MTTSLPSRKERNSGEEEPGEPHEALFLVLSYLPLFELLAMSEVCVSMRDAVKEDKLPWLNVIVQRPLSSRFSDRILLKVTSKADGRLKTLALLNCTKITDDGLQTVIDRNPLINKLCLKGCTGLTPDGIVRVVKALSEQQHSLKSLQINGIYNIKKEHLETIHYHLLMNQAQQFQQQKQQPVLYHEYRNSATYRHEDQGRMTDVDICPGCKEVRMVFDCPRETCRKKREQFLIHCRACKFCISRCVECGNCVKFEELEVAICADTLCYNCWMNLPKCNFCNQPYCKLHLHQHRSSAAFTGWVCEFCHVQSIYHNPI